MKFYIATGLENANNHNLVRDALVELGHEITYDWTTHGAMWMHGPVVMEETAKKELQGVYDADFVVVILPGGRGTHVELGAAIMCNKRLFIFAQDDAAFEPAPGVCVFHFCPGIERITGDLSVLAPYLHGELTN